MYCSVLQCIAVCCSVSGELYSTLLLVCSALLFVAIEVSCSEFQCVAVRCSVLQWANVLDSFLLLTLLQWVAVCCSVLQCFEVLQCVAVCCSVLQCAAVYCSGL